MPTAPPSRIAADIMAIAQGVAATQADLEILRNGVADITELLERKIRETWVFVEAEVKSERDLQQHRAEVAHERRVSDHETVEAHFARLNSAVNDRFIEFDERIFHMNESRAGSISVQLQETIRTTKRYPDALRYARSPSRFLTPRHTLVRFSKPLPTASKSFALK